MLGGILSRRVREEVVSAYRALLRGRWTAVDDTDVRRMLEALLAAVGGGDIILFEERLVGSSVRRNVDEEIAQAATQRLSREETTWVSILLVDDADPPQPVPGVRYTIELPDGATREGRLDRLGRARIDGIDPGTCKVSFQDLDGRDWS